MLYLGMIFFLLMPDEIWKKNQRKSSCVESRVSISARRPCNNEWSLVHCLLIQRVTNIFFVLHCKSVGTANEIQDWTIIYLGVLTSNLRQTINFRWKQMLRNGRIDKKYSIQNSKIATVFASFSIIDDVTKFSFLFFYFKGSLIFSAKSNPECR